MNGLFFLGNIDIRSKYMYNKLLKKGIHGKTKNK